MKYTVVLLVDHHADDPSHVLDEVTHAIAHAVNLDQEAVDAGIAVTVEERQGGGPSTEEPVSVDVAFDLIDTEIKERAAELKQTYDGLRARFVADHEATAAILENYARRIQYLTVTLALLAKLRTDLEEQCGD